MIVNFEAEFPRQDGEQKKMLLCDVIIVQFFPEILQSLARYFISIEP